MQNNNLSEQEKKKQYRKKYYEENKEKLCLYSRLYYWKHKNKNIKKKNTKQKEEIKGFMKINQKVTLTFE